MTGARRPRGLEARLLVALARADFLARVRRGSFLVVIALAIWAAYVFLPPNHARYVTLQFDGHRGIYNSAWIGTLVAMQCTVFVGFAGFYLIKNAVARDRETGVGAVLATTPMSRIEYAIGKWLSNLAVLASMVAVVAVAAGAMQLARGEDPRLDPLVLFTPFVLLTLPALSLLAALALVFEMVPWLRGGLGNVGFFFLWIGGISSPLLNRSAVFDVVGLSTVIPAIELGVHAIHPGYVVDSHHFSMGFNFRSGDGTWDLVTFPWTGIEWTGGIIAPRAGLVAVALGLTLVAALLFDRFDTATVPRRASRKSCGPAAAAPAEAALMEVGTSAPRSPTLTFARIPGIGRIRPGLMGLMVAEVVLMLRGVGPWWKLAAAGLIVAGFVAPLAMARTGFLSAALIWPLTSWSALGHRESRHHTEALVFSTPRPTTRVFLAQWVAGTLCAIAIGLGPLIRGVMTGDALPVAAQLAGSMFVPALALACGAWSGSARLFEVIYVLLWYAGPLQRASFLDYPGMHGTTPSRVLGWGVIAAALVALAMVGRRLRSRG